MYPPVLQNLLYSEFAVMVHSWTSHKLHTWAYIKTIGTIFFEIQSWV